MNLPKHIAVIMDGNGRWANQRKLPRIAGHKAGVDAVRLIIQTCAEKGIEILTLFAFSSENWQRPKQEVDDLMGLFSIALQREIKHLHKNNVRLRVIGDISRFSAKLQEKIIQGQLLTKNNTGLTVVIAANYGGRWDLTQAVQTIAQQVRIGTLQLEDINPDLINQYLSTGNLPEPDLLIRTSGEKRISNFLLWQLAYSELYFTDVMWPDFSVAELNKAIEFFAARERRFGFTSEQINHSARV